MALISTWRSLKSQMASELQFVMVWDTLCVCVCTVNIHIQKEAESRRASGKQGLRWHQQGLRKIIVLISSCWLCGSYPSVPNAAADCIHFKQIFCLFPLKTTPIWQRKTESCYKKWAPERRRISQSHPTGNPNRLVTRCSTDFSFFKEKYRVQMKLQIQ